MPGTGGGSDQVGAEVLEVFAIRDRVFHSARVVAQSATHYWLEDGTGPLYGKVRVRKAEASTTREEARELHAHKLRLELASLRRRMDKAEAALRWANAE